MTQLAASPLLLLELTVAIGAGAFAFALFVHWEQAGRPEIAVAFLGGALLAQNVLYKTDAGVPIGPLRPGPLRIFEIIIIVAIAARLWVRSRGSHVSATAIAWSAFFAWYFGAALIGWLGGNSSTLVLFHGKFIVYAGGAAVLASGVPIRRLVSRATFGPWLVGFGAIVLVQVLSTLTDRQLVIDEIGADSASVYLGLGLLVLLLEGSKRGARMPIVLATAPLVVAPLVTDQRASVIHAAVTCFMLSMVMLGRRWSRRMDVRPTQLALGATAILAALAFLVLPNLSEGRAVPPTVSSSVAKTFGGLGNQQSSAARVNQWDSASTLFHDQPLLGQGLGVEHTYFKPGIWFTGEFVTGNVFDNTVLDIVVRSGLVGLLLFFTAMTLTIRDAWRVWIGHNDRRVAAFGLAATTFLVGLSAKGLVESILEKGTVACVFGLAIGAIASATRDMRDPVGSTQDPDVDRFEPVW